MSFTVQIREKLEAAFPGAQVDLENESYKHNVPEGSESHFRVVIVSDVFGGVSRVRRHQQVYGLLQEELAGGVHALSLHTYTGDEWAARGASAEASPDCMGGSARERRA